MKYLLLIASLFLIIPVHADTFNVSYANTKYDYSFPADLIFDDQSNGFSLTYGFEVNPNWYVDINYSNLGTADRTFFLTPTEFTSQQLSVSAHANVVVGTVSGHNVTLDGMLGLVYSDAKAKAGLISINDTDTGFIGGFGGAVWLSPTSAITLMYERADLKFDNTVMFDYDPAVLKIGYTMKF